MAPRVTLAPLAGLTDLALRWQSLEALANPGPFRAWPFISHVAARFTAPHLISVTDNGTDLILALLNRARHRLHLHETGSPAQDAIFIEHNGLLVRPGAEPHVLASLRHLAATAPLTLSGVDDAHLQVARQAGSVIHQQTRFAPAVNLHALEGPFIDTLSANARAQMRRAIRLAEPGLAIERAADLPTARAWFAEMVDLHQASWLARGKPGAFANASLYAFHTALIETAHPRGEADLLRVSSAGRTLGILYVLRQGGHACVYQSGFVRTDDPRQKPGLVCHVQAIEFYRSEGATIYDLLAGPDRYKTTLARTGGRMLHWFTLHPASSITARARRLAERAVTQLRS